MFNQQEFMHIMSDAYVADLDFSRWDKQVDLYVYADHTPRDGESKGFYRVSFVRVSEWAMQFGHMEMGLDLGEDQSVHWTIDDYRLEEERDAWRLEFWGMPSSPKVRLRCERVEIERLNARVVPELFPEWDEQRRSFARPGLVEMALARPGRRS